MFSENPFIEMVSQASLGGLCLYLATECYSAEIKHSEEVEKVKETFRKVKEYEPDELGKKLEEEYKNNKNNEKFIDCGKFFVRGVLSCDNPLNTFVDGKMDKLIYSRITTYDLMAELGEKNILKHTKKFSKQESSYANGIQLQPSYPTTYNKFRFFLENLQSSIKGDVIHFIGSKETSLFPGGINFTTIGVGSVIKIGFEKNEFGIKVGDKITVYGQVLFDCVNKIIKMSKPSHILSSKEEFENFISNSSLSILGVFLFGGLFALETVLFAKALYSIFQSKSKR